MHKSGELKKRGDLLWSMMNGCTLCPRECKSLRLDGEEGLCGAGEWLMIASFSAHFGEEEGLVGSQGSGTIFFSNCNLKCLFCQNYDISHLGHGETITIKNLSEIMLNLQSRGCHNINIVTPTHYSAHLVKALDIAAGNGLNIPLVYNTSSWERMEVLKLLQGVVDIYLADMKFMEAKSAGKYLHEADNYADFALPALREMHRQVGVAASNKKGIIESGLMIRHLVMPGNVSASDKAMMWIADNLSSDTYVNIMAQYHPSYRAHEFPEIDRSVTVSEYSSVVKSAKDAGLSNLDIQGRFL